MAWYNEAVFYHIYPIGMTGAPKKNDYSAPVSRLNNILPWLSHIKEMGCNAIYIGPLFESVGHGYETTDYKKLDSRLGTNKDLKNFVAKCHKEGIRVILDGVFNHTGRDFFAFQDIKKNRESSPHRDWYCNVNFSGNNSFGDGFSYENWGGYDLLVKLNQKNPQVVKYICDVIRFWIREFDIDGIRLDAADVMDFDYMKAFRRVADEVKEDFWLMGEVIHGDYSRWANDTTLHSVTNYVLHKALFSAFNDHNFFEIAHTIKYVNNMVGDCSKLYTFTDNHDVERIASKLKDKANLLPVYILLYTLPGIPSIYYGSVWQIGEDYVIKIYSDLTALRRNVLINNSLESMGIPVGKILRTTSGEEVFEQDGQYCFVSKKLSGSNIVSLKFGNKIGETMGRIIADLHKAFENIEKELNPWDNCLLEEMNGWVSESFEKGGWQNISKEEYEEVVVNLSKSYSQLPFQLIHRDVHFGNFLFDKGTFSGYIDFDLSQKNVRIFDLCYFVMSVLSEKEKFNLTEEKWFDFAGNVFAGYNKTLPLTEAEKQSAVYVMECIELLFMAFFEGQEDSALAQNTYKIFSFIKANERRITKLL